MAQGQSEEAVTMLKRSLELQRDPETHFNLAAAYLGMIENHAAEEQLDAAIALRPYMAVAWKYKATIFVATGVFTEARDAFVRSLQFEPLDNSVYNELVTLLHQIGEHSEAERYQEIGMRLSKSMVQSPVPN